MRQEEALIKYASARKKALTKMMELVYKRSLLNREIARLRAEMNNWDTALVKLG